MGLVAPLTREQTAEFDELTRVVKSGKCVAFVGAGLSQPQCPGWRSLIELLCRECRVEVEQLPEADRTNPLSLASHAKQADEHRYTEILLQEFGQPEPVARQLALAGILFRAFVTLNYDPILKKSLELKASAGKEVVVYRYPHLPVSCLGDPDSSTEHLSQRLLYHIHGLIDQGTTVPEIVLTSQEYDKAYNSTPLRSFITQLFTYFPICFLGCGLSDDVMLQGIIRLCGRIQKNLADRSPHQPPRWYMLVDTDELSCLKMDLNEHGIKPVPFHKANEEYEGLDDILKKWAGIRPARLPVPFEGTKGLYKADQELSL